MWFISVKVEQETSAPPPKENLRIGLWVFTDKKVIISLLSIPCGFCCLSVREKSNVFLTIKLLCKH